MVGYRDKIIVQWAFCTASILLVVAQFPPQFCPTLPKGGKVGGSFHHVTRFARLSAMKSVTYISAQTSNSHHVNRRPSTQFFEIRESKCMKSKLLISRTCSHSAIPRRFFSDRLRAQLYMHRASLSMAEHQQDSPNSRPRPPGTREFYPQP